MFVLSSTPAVNVIPTTEASFDTEAEARAAFVAFAEGAPVDGYATLWQQCPTSWRCIARFAAGGIDVDRAARLPRKPAGTKFTGTDEPRGALDRHAVGVEAPWSIGQAVRDAALATV